MRIFFSLCITFGLITGGIQTAFAGQFSDISEDHPYYSAIESLAHVGVLEGYDDGTFRPDQLVNRAEALKIILTSEGVQIDKGLYSTGFFDVPLDSWYAGFVMEGLFRAIVSGNPDGSFAPARNVNEAEYLKMTLITSEIDLSQHENISSAIAIDVQPGQWYTPYMSYAKTVGLIFPNLDDTLEPGKQLNRGECAQITYKLALMKAGGNSQKMLFITEAKLVDALVKIHNDNIVGALKLSEDAIAYSNLALQEEPDSSVIKATNLIAKAFKKLFLAYEAGLIQDTDQIKALVNDAITLASEAVSTNSSANYFAQKIEEHSKALLAQI